MSAPDSIDPTDRVAIFSEAVQSGVFSADEQSSMIIIASLETVFRPIFDRS